MTSHAPTPGRPARPCTAELLAAAELPATTAGTAATGPKIPPFVGDAPVSACEPSPARTVELLIAEALRATTPESAVAGPKLPPYRGD
jgi:hypothetical protein